MQNRRVQMDEHIGKTKGKAAHDPFPVLVDLFFLRFYNGYNRHREPNHAQYIKGDARRSASSGVRGHIAGSEHNKKDAQQIKIAVYPVPFAKFILKRFGKVDDANDHRGRSEYGVNAHNGHPDPFVFRVPRTGLMA